MSALAAPAAVLLWIIVGAIALALATIIGAGIVAAIRAYREARALKAKARRLAAHNARRAAR